MTWEHKEELEKKRKQHPDEKYFRVDTNEKRVETDLEYKQRIGERNIGLMNGILLGILIGLLFLTIPDAVQQIWGIRPNPYVELVISILFVTWFLRMFSVISEDRFRFTSSKIFRLYVIIAFLIIILILYVDTIAIKLGIIIPQ